MENSIYIALSRQVAMRREVDVSANNIANVDTPSFKGERVIFREYISRPDFRESHSFVDDVGTSRNTNLGTFRTTNNPLDISIGDEQSYFTLDTPIGERYTRNGHFELNENGDLVNTQGHIVKGRGRTINFPQGATQFTITGKGEIVDDITGVVIDQLRVVKIPNPNDLKHAANNLYVPEPNAQINVNPDPQLVQGTLEASNVQAIVELTRMMEISRNYQSITQFSDKENERITKMINGLGSSV